MTIPRIHTIEMPMPGMLGNVNCYAVVNGSRAALIDTGMAGPDCETAIQKKLAEIGHSPGSIEMVFCTHYHPDHCGMGKVFEDNGVPLYMSKKDAASLQRWLESIPMDAQLATFFGEHQLPEDFGESVTPVFSYLRTLQQPCAPVAVDSSQRTIDLAGVPFEMIPTPGHTDGHVCLVQRELNIVFTGDHILPDSAVNILIQEQSEHQSPLAVYLRSLEEIMILGKMKGLPGHGVPIPDIRERCSVLRDLHLQRVAQVRSVLCEEPFSATDISSRAFGRKRRAFSRWLGMAQTISCLEYLVQHGEVQCHLQGNMRTYSLVDVKQI